MVAVGFCFAGIWVTRIFVWVSGYRIVSGAAEGSNGGWDKVIECRRVRKGMA